MTADEELLIQAARKKRQARRSGRNMLLTLALAAVSAVIGWLLLFRLRPFIKAVPLLPTGSVTAFLLWAGIGFFAIAAVSAAGAWLVAGPRRPWGKPFPGKCPECGATALRESAIEVEKRDAADFNVGPRGLVILCGARGCDYAVASVTTPSRG